MTEKLETRINDCPSLESFIEGPFLCLWEAPAIGGAIALVGACLVKGAYEFATHPEYIETIKEYIKFLF